MWISRRRWQELSDRVTDLESKLRYRTKVYIPKEQCKECGPFTVSAYYKGHDSDEIGTHKGFEVAELLKAIAERDRMFWNQGQPGKLVSGKKAK